MNKQHEIFAAALAAGFDGKRAALIAGYSVNSAAVIACRLRKRNHIRAEVERIKRCEEPALHRRTGLDLTPIEFLISMMNDNCSATSLRLRAARAALPYLVAKR